MQTSSDIRDKILATARKRFAKQGYCRTGMAKIASDTGMSAGNLYRYFESKLDIAEALCREACTDIYDQLSVSAKDTGAPAEKRLRNFVQGELRLSYQRLEELPRLVEMAEDLIAKRPQVKEAQLRTSRSLLVEILAQGIASKEFQINDVLGTARAIQTGTMKYRYPQLFSKQPLPVLKDELDRLMDLLLNGISSQNEQISENLSLTFEETQLTSA